MRPVVTLAALALIMPLLGGAAAPGPAAMPPAGRYAKLRGIRVYYEEHGRGPALILLHGGLGNGLQFAKRVPEYAQHYRVIVPDACAQGRTSDRPRPLTYHDEAEDVLALMDRLHLRTARVLGWSDGGNAGLDLASRHPERVSHLVTFGANFSKAGLKAEDQAWGDTATAASLGPEMEKGYRELAADPDHYAVAMNKILTMWRSDPGLTLEDLGHIRARTFVIAGEHDVIRQEHTEALAHAIPGAKLWIVPGANHAVMNDRADLVTPAVLEFLEH